MNQENTAKRTKRYTSEQVSQISKNFNFLVNKVGLSKAELSKDNIIRKGTYDKLIHYNDRYYKYNSEWCPHEGTLKKIVSYFNKNYSPKVTVQDLINLSFENINFSPQKREISALDWYAGTYFCYYLNASGKYCNYGILKVYYDNSDTVGYVCEAILGFEEEELNKLSEIFSVLSEQDTSQSIKSIYNSYIQNNTQKFENISYIPYAYFSGNVILSCNSVTFCLTNEKNSFVRVITLKRFDNASKYNRYQGGMGSMLTTTSSDKPTVLKNIGFSLVNIGEHLPRIKELLKINLNSDGQIQTNAENGVIVNDNRSKNKHWFKLVESQKIALIQNEQCDHEVNKKI